MLLPSYVGGLRGVKMRSSYRLEVRAVHQDPDGAAQVLLSGTGSGWAALLIVDVHPFGETPIIPVTGEQYVLNLSPDPERETTRVRC